MNKLCLCVIALVIASVAHGQMSRDLHDLQIRYREARADASAYLKINSITVKGTLEQDGRSMAFELTQRSSGEVRYTLDTPDGTVTQVYDGEDGWRWIAGQPSLGVRKLTPQQLRFFLLNNSFLTPFDSPDSFRLTTSYKGLELNEQNIPEHHVRLEGYAHGDVLDVWIDANSFVESRRAYAPEEGTTPLVTEFSDYERMDGLLVPRLVKTSFNGKVIAEAKLEKVVRNSGMLSFYFTKPSSYKVVTDSSGIAAQKR
ncbi:hypothetical protein [Cerasicoccus fimbriatus]|uniref:hypothetical protein n=1 Tax=Cerasicoccus fimbriatus TaxID=3014554 RepID=UPI0022B388A8|nr:hypothetical protein [Cerasicoccus sp. TK19100]